MPNRKALSGTKDWTGLRAGLQAICWNVSPLGVLAIQLPVYRSLCMTMRLRGMRAAVRVYLILLLPFYSALSIIHNSVHFVSLLGTLVAYSEVTALLEFTQLVNGVG